MKSAGKRLEDWVRRIRPYLRPSYRKAYRSLMARGLAERKPGEPIVCCDFSDPAIDGVGGRYYFSLVLDLIDAGWFPVFSDHRVTVSTFGTSRVKSLLLKKRLGSVKSIDEITEPFFLITDSDVVAERATKTVRVDYAQRIPQQVGERAFPVFVHPQIAIMDQLPFPYEVGEQRQVRLFFGGNTSEGKYDKNVIGEVYSMLTRREMLEIVRDEVTEPNIFRPLDAGQWLGENAPHAFVLCETQICKIPPARWLEALSKGDFFLACPGVGMPLCHNLVESMAAGAIPILEYSRYLTPMLENGVNCLTFHHPASLREVIARVLKMDQEEILTLRKGVRAYYDEFMAPGRFAKRLLQDPSPDTRLLMNAYRVPR